MSAARGCAALLLVLSAFLSTGLADALAASKWDTAIILPDNRAGFSATLLGDGRVLVAGGLPVTTGGPTDVLNTAFIVDPAEGDVIVVPGTMAMARYGHRAVRLSDGRVVIFGGIGADGNSTNAVEIFTPSGATGSFAASATTMNQPRSRFTATLLGNGNVLIAGGEQFTASGSSRTVTATVEVYNPSLGTFTEGDPMTVGRTRHTATPSFLEGDVVVLIAGGENESVPHGDFDVYAPGGALVASGNLGDARSGHQAVPLADGRVLIVGGGPTTARLIDLFLGAEPEIGHPVLPRIDAAAVLLPTGKVLIVGGHFPDQPLAVADGSAELFDPLDAAGSFSLTDPPSEFVSALSQFPPAAVLLRNGRVMVIGQPRLSSAQFAQIYRPDPVRGYVTRHSGDLHVFETSDDAVPLVSALPTPGGYGVAVERGRVWVAQSGGSQVFELDPSHITSAHPGNVLRTFSGLGSTRGIAASIDPAAEGRLYGADQTGSQIAVIDTVSNTASSPIPLAGGSGSWGVDAQSPSRLAVANELADTVAVIDTSSGSIQELELALVIGGGPHGPRGVAFNPRIPEFAYVTLFASNALASIQTAGVPVLANHQAAGSGPEAVAVTPDGLKVYIANRFSHDVSVFDFAGNPILDGGVPRRVAVGVEPRGLALTPDGRRLYVVNAGRIEEAPGSISVIDTASDTVIAGPPLPGAPSFDIIRGTANAFGKFIGRFDTPGPVISDLGVDTLTTSTPSSTVGALFDYSVTVRNNGPDVASAVALDLGLSARVSYQAIVDFGLFHGCFIPNPVVCVLPSMAPGESTTLVVRVRAESAGLADTSATLTALTMDPDPTPADNVKAIEISISAGGGGGSADLSVSKVASAASLVAGNALTYTITVTNGGPDAATGVTLTDTLPAGVTFVSASPGCSGVAPGGTGTVTCALGTLAASTGVEVTLVVNVTPTATGFDLSNTASVSATTADPVGGNNSSTATTTITAASLSGRITQTDGVTPIANATVNTDGAAFFRTHTGSDGSYAFSGLPAGIYRIRATAAGFQATWYVAATSQTGASPVTVTAGAVRTGVDIKLPAGAGGIVGRVQATGGGGIAGVNVAIFLAAGDFVMGVRTDEAGNYDTGRVLAPGVGRYKVGIGGNGFENLYWNNKTNQSAADPITVTAGTDTTGIDFTVSTTVGGFTGTVTDGPGGPGLPDIDVFVVEASTNSFVTNTRTNASGVYDLSARLRIGTAYKIEALAPGFVRQFYNGKATAGAADTVTIVDATPVTIDFALARGGGITGQITNAGAPLAGAIVEFFDAPTNGSRERVVSDGNGNYTAERRLQPGGAYKIRARFGGRATTFYDDKFTFTTADIVTVTAAGVDETGKNIVLAAGGRITGRVTDTAPTPVGLAGAIVEFFDAANNLSVASTTAAADGAYDTGPILPALTYRVRARKPGYVHTLHPAAVDFVTATTVTVAAGATVPSIDIAMPPGGTITGTIRERGINGGPPPPIPGATVTVFRVAANTFQGIFTVTTDVNGTFTIQGLRDGEWYLRASKPGFVLGFWTGDPNRLATDSGMVTSIAISGANTVTNVDLNLAAGGGTLQGTITRADNGQPVPAGTTVTVRGLFPHLFWTGFVTTTTTDASGSYTFTGLPLPFGEGGAAVGHYIVEANGNQAVNGTAIGWYPTGASSFSTAQAVTVSASGITSGIDFALPGFSGGQSPRTISGIVRASGAPVAFAQVAAFDPFTQNAVRFTTTNGDGTYTLNQLRPGRYVVRVFTETTYETQFYSGESLTATGAPVDVTTGNQTGIDFALSATAGTMTGRITRADNGQPIAGAQISVRNFLHNPAGGDTAGVDGGFLARGLPAGTYPTERYKVRVSAPGFITRYYTATGSGGLIEGAGMFVTVTSNSNTPEINVALEPGGGTITGTLRREIAGGGDEPAAGASVTFRRTDVPMPPVGDAETGAIVFIARVDATGAFEAHGLAPGEYKVFFLAERAAHQWYDGKDSLDTADTATVAPGATTNLGTRVLTRANGTIAGHVFQSDGETPLANAGVFLFDALTGAFVRSAGVTDSQGRFRREGFPPGPSRYVAEARAPGFSPEFFANVPDRPSATPLSVTDGSETGGVNFSLDPVGTPTPTNGDPIAIAREVTTAQNTAIAITLIGADAETALDDLTYEIVEGAAHGALSVDGRVWTYHPAEGFTGRDSFSFKVTDRGRPDGCGSVGPNCAGPKTSAPAVVSIIVTGTSGTSGSALSAPVIPADGEPSEELGAIEIVENSAGQLTPGSPIVVSLPPGLTFATGPMVPRPMVCVVVSNGLAIVPDGVETQCVEPELDGGQFSFAIAQPSTTGRATLRISSISVIVAPGFVPSGQRAIEVSITVGGVTAPPLTIGTAVATLPFINTLSIDRIVQGAQDQTVIITGGNFDAGATVLVGPDVFPAAVDSPTQITTTISVAANAQLGDRIVTVTNPDGQSATFDPGKPPIIAITAAPIVTATDRTGPVVIACRTGPGPLCLKAKNQHLNISGENFQDGFTIEFSGEGITVLAFGRYSPTEIWADVDVADTMDVSSRTVTVINSDGGRGTSATPVVDVAVAPPDAPEVQGAAKVVPVKTVAAPGAPKLTSLTPTSGVVGTTVTVAGSFGTNANTVAVNFAGPGTTRVPAPVATFSSTRLTVKVPAGAVDGPVTVTNTATGVPSTGVGFTVTDPRLSLVLPRSAPSGTSAVMTLVGSKFFSGATVSFDPADGISLGAVSASGEGTQLQVPIAIAAGAQPGKRSVTVQNPASAGGTSSTLLLAFEITAPAPVELRLSLIDVPLQSYLPRVEAVAVTLDAAGRCTAKAITPSAVRVRAEFFTTGSGPPPPEVTFILSSSAIPGTAFNEDCELNLAAPASDFSLASAGGAPDVTVQRVKANGAGVYEAVLHAWDFGGKVTIEAEGILANGTLVKGKLTLPLDTDGDDLPDAYESDAALNGTTLNALNPDQNASGTLDRDDRFARDGLSNFEKYRGIYRKRPASGAGPMTDHVRLGAGMRHLFVRGVGFGDSSEPGFCGVRIDAATGARIPQEATAQDLALGCPRFQVGLAFQNIGVEVHNVSPSFEGGSVLPRRSLADPSQPLLDMAEITFVAGCYGSERCHISKFGARQWQIPTLGFNTAAFDAKSYGTDTKLYKGAFEAYFNDRPYEHRTNDALAIVTAPDGTPMLAPIASVGDSSKTGADNGLANTGERLGSDGRLAGDTYIPGRFDLQLTLLDSNSDGCGELPFVADPTTLAQRCDPAADYGSGPANGALVDASLVTRPPASGLQATRQQAVRAIITHELGHATGAAHQDKDPNCIMYGATINWIRDHRFSPDATAPSIQIHNKGGLK